MRPLFAAFTLGALLALSTPVLAQSSLADFDKAKTALLQVWGGMPLSVRNVTLIQQSAPGYGDYTPREGRSYKPDEAIHVYVEVLGYGWKDNGDGTQSELLDADLNLLDSSGTPVAQQQGFLNADIKSRTRLLETYLNLSATLSSFEPGDYALEFVLHDRAAGKTATFRVPVTVVAADAAASSSSAQ